MMLGKITTVFGGVSRPMGEAGATSGLAADATPFTEVATKLVESAGH